MTKRGRAAAALVLLAGCTAGFCWSVAAGGAPELPGGPAADAATVAAPGARSRDAAMAEEPTPQGEGAARALAAPDGPEGTAGVQITCCWAADRTPAAAIPVQVDRLQGRASIGRVATGQTDAAGIVTFAPLAVGEYAFRAARATVRVVVEPGRIVSAVLSLPTFLVLRGMVVDTAGAPVAAAAVGAEIDGLPHVVAATGDDGRFALRLPGRTRLWASKEGHGPSAIANVTRDADDVVLRLESGGVALRGTVLDPDGSAVAGAAVAIASAPDAAVGAGSERERPSHPHVMLTSDSRGAFATTQAPPRRLVVYAHAVGFAFGQQEVDAGVAAPGHVVVRLRRAASLQGIVVGGDDATVPLAGASVSVHRQRDLAGLLQGSSDLLTRAYTSTDAAGRFRLTGLAPGRMWLTAGFGAELRYASLVLRDGEVREWNVDLTRPRSVIRGILQGPDGEPLAGWQVHGKRIDPVQMKQESARSETDADGRFELRRLRPFPHDVIVQSAGEVVAVRRDVPPDAPPIVVRVTGLPARAGAIVGQVLGPDGAPLHDATITATCDGASRRANDDDRAPGGFRIERTFPGTWRVAGRSASYGSFALGEHPVTADVRLDVGLHRLPAHGHVVVRLTGASVEPSGIVVVLEQADGANRSAAFEPHEGALRSPGLPPGTYRLQVRGTDVVPIARTITIAPDVTLDVAVAVHPAPSVTFEFVPEELAESEWDDDLRITVRDAHGAPICTHRQHVRGAPTATFTLGLAAGTYTVEATATQIVYRRATLPFRVPPDPPEAQRRPLHHIRVPLTIQ